MMSNHHPTTKTACMSFFHTNELKLHCETGLSEASLITRQPQANTVQDYFKNVVTVNAQLIHSPVLLTPAIFKCLHDPNLEGVTLG